MKLDKQKLETLMNDFYILTGIKVAVFDSDYREILSYPHKLCNFCRLIRSDGKIKELCTKSDNESFEYCRKNMKQIIYHCHAGLVEATAPLIYDDAIIGYIMIGQITDICNTGERIRNLRSVCDKYGISDENLDSYITDIEYKNREQIGAAVKILETITFYVMQKDIISLEKKSFINRLNKYIEDNLEDDIPVERICGEINIGRSTLYEMSVKYLGMGIAKYIRLKRINKAKELLRNTADPISDIALKVGFSDYNYFCRTFKKEANISAKKYRDQFR